MTRLDSAIRRLTAQRDVLDWAARDVAGRPGLILELGLGNGRTYDHLRARLPGRDIYVFERQPAAHPDCLPPPGRLIVGSILESLPAFLDRFGPGCAALIHADLGTGDTAASRRLTQAYSPLVEALLATDGLMLDSEACLLPRCVEISGEMGVARGRYFVYRRLAEPEPAAARPAPTR